MALQKSGETKSVETVLDSSLDSVDKAEDTVLRVAGGIGFPEEDIQRIGMAVREAMVNAVVHGNRYNANRKVHLSVFTGANHLRVVIRDEGAGFDFESLPDPLAEENLLRQSGRGLLLIRAFVDECQFRHVEPHGTEIQLVKHRTET